MNKLNAMQQRDAVQFCWCGYLHLVDELQTDRLLNHEFENAIVYMHHPTLFAKRTEKQGSLNWLTAPYYLPLWIMTK